MALDPCIIPFWNPFLLPVWFRVQRKRGEMKQRLAWKRGVPMRGACDTKHWLVGKIGCAARPYLTPNAVSSHLPSLERNFIFCLIWGPAGDRWSQRNFFSIFEQGCVSHWWFSRANFQKSAPKTAKTSCNDSPWTKKNVIFETTNSLFRVSGSQLHSRIRRSEY